MPHSEHGESVKPGFTHVTLTFRTWQGHIWSVGSVICVHRETDLCEKKGDILIFQDGYLLFILLFLTKKCYNKHEYYVVTGDRGCTVVKALCYKSEGRWFDPRLCQWIFH